MNHVFDPNEPVFYLYPGADGRPGIREGHVFAMVSESNTYFIPPPDQPHVLVNGIAHWWQDVYRTQAGAEFRRLIMESVGHIHPWDAAQGGK